MGVSAPIRCVRILPGICKAMQWSVGMLVFDGIENLVDGSFVETVTGQICVDLAP